MHDPIFYSDTILNDFYRTLEARTNTSPIMKRYLLYVWVLMLLGVVSCTKEETLGGSESQPNPKVTHSTLTPDEAERFVLLNDDYAVSKAEMLMRAKGVIAMIERGKSATKSIRRTPVLVDSLMSAPAGTKNRTIASNTKIYVVSFGADRGFALLAGDKRAEGVIGYSEEGTYDPNDVSPGMKFFLTCILDALSHQIQKKEKLRGDSIYNTLVHRYGTFGKRSETATKYPVWNGIEYVDMPVDNITDELYEYTTEVTSSMILCKSKWDQYYPYNVSINKYYNNGIDYPTGCVTTAVAQIMNFHQFGTYKGYNYYWDRFVSKDWTNVSEDVINSIGDLFKHLANADNLAARPGANGTLVEEFNIHRTFRNFGYRDDSTSNYNHITAREEVKKGFPVIIGGRNPSRVGHSWIIDGYQIQTYWEVWRVNYWYQGHLQGSELVKRNPQNIDGNVHVNWGWGGKQDFWSTSISFPYKNPQTGELSNFNGNMTMITGIRPNR